MPLPKPNKAHSQCYAIRGTDNREKSYLNRKFVGHGYANIKAAKFAAEDMATRMNAQGADVKAILQRLSDDGITWQDATT